jgi:uncharacterized membrane protein YjgN (DUF898 family)
MIPPSPQPSPTRGEGVSPTNLPQPFSFSGSGGEYFRIWIVNLLLSIITLGIYSAWAKVRRTQYFYRHTSVAGASFDYHGDPKAILQGRIIAFVLFALYSATSHFNPVIGVGIFALIMAVMPWLVVRSLRFRLHNSSYRGLRFSFVGKVGEGYLIFLLLPIAAYASLGLLWPLVHQQITRYIRNHSRYGNEFFSFHSTAGAFYRPYVVVALCLIAMLGVSPLIIFGMDASRVSSLSSTVIGALIVGFYLVMLLLVYPYITSRLQNLIWNNTTLGPHHFESVLSARGLFWVMASNIVLVILTLGLFKPFADIRLLRYKLEHLTLLPGADLEDFLAGQQVTATATGEEVAEMFDVDIAF